MDGIAADCEVHFCYFFHTLPFFAVAFRSGAKRLCLSTAPLDAIVGEMYMPPSTHSRPYLYPLIKGFNFLVQTNHAKNFAQNIFGSYRHFTVVSSKTTLLLYKPQPWVDDCEVLP